MSLVNPCQIAARPINTGSECSDSLKASGLIMLVPLTDRWDADDMADFTSFVKGKIHAAPGQRWYPIFGNRAPIRQITDAKEADVLETMEDGSTQFIRFGMYNRTFYTTDGGLCLAKALMSLTAAGKYGFIEFDIIGQVAQMDNGDGTFSAFPLNLGYGPAPELANLKTAYKNALYLSFSPQTYIKKGKIFASSPDEDLLSLSGLLDVTVYLNGTPTVAGATAAQGGFTIVKGATNDTIDVKVNGVSISGGPVVQTVTENTDTLLAAKVAAAINAHAGWGPGKNSGFGATNALGVLTITASGDYGTDLNGVQPTATIVGTITANTALVPFAGGVRGTVTFPLGVKTECGESDLIALFGADLVKLGNFVCEDEDGDAVVISAVALTGGKALVTIPLTIGTYDFNLIDTVTLYGQNIQGYEGITPGIGTVPF